MPSPEETILRQVLARVATAPTSFVEDGTVGSIAARGSNILDGKGKNWPTDAFRTLVVEVYEGQGSHQARAIAGNSPNALVIVGQWERDIAVGAKFRILAPMDLRQALRDVLGGGADINAGNPLQVYDPKVGSLVSYSGTTTADGAANGSTLICSDLTGEPDFNGNHVIVTSGAYTGQARIINGATTGGTVTPSSAFGGQIVAGVTFVIVAIRTVFAEVAALQLDIGDASASALGSLYGILGNPAQTFTTRTQRIEEGAAVYFDAVGGSAGVAYPVGTPQTPVNNVADLLAICAARGISTVVLLSNLTLTANVSGLTFIGSLPGITRFNFGAAWPGIANASGCVFRDLSVGGYQTNLAAAECTYIDCLIGDFDVTDNLWGKFYNCTLGFNTCNFKAAGFHYLFNPLFMEAAIDWGDSAGFFVTNGRFGTDGYNEISSMTGSGGTHVSLDLYGGQLRLYGVDGDEIWLYGDFQLQVAWSGGEIYDYRINRAVEESVVRAKPFFSEFWLPEAIDAAIWTPTNPATGAAWSVVQRGQGLVAYTAPNADEVARLVSVRRYPAGGYDANTIAQKLIMEWEMELDTVANVDNTLSFFGLTRAAGDDRTTQNIIGICLSGDEWCCLCDYGGTEFTSVQAAYNPAILTKFRIEWEIQLVRWFMDEVLVASSDFYPGAYPLYPNFFIDTEAGGAAQFYLGPARIWIDDRHWKG